MEVKFMEPGLLTPEPTHRQPCLCWGRSTLPQSLPLPPGPLGEELSWAQAPSGQPSRPLRANDNKENKTVKHRIQESSLQAGVRVGGEQPLLTALL